MPGPPRDQVKGRPREGMATVAARNDDLANQRLFSRLLDEARAILKSIQNISSNITTSLVGTITVSDGISGGGAIGSNPNIGLLDDGILPQKLKANTTVASASTFYRGDGSWQTAGGTGTVTSVGLATPSIFTVSGSPVVGAGTLSFSPASQAANLVWAGPASGVSAAPDFRALVAADIPVLLDSHARVSVRRNSLASTVGPRRRLNFIEGTNITLVINDDSANEEIDVTISSSGGGGGTSYEPDPAGGSVWDVATIQDPGTGNELDYVNHYAGAPTVLTGSQTINFTVGDPRPQSFILSLLASATDTFTLGAGTTGKILYFAAELTAPATATLVGNLPGSLTSIVLDADDEGIALIWMDGLWRPFARFTTP